MELKRIVNGVEVLAAIAALVFVVMLFANEPGDGGAATSSPGGQIYEANCASCHGADGSGGIGPKLAGEVADAFPDIEDQIALVTDGRGSMPSFDGRLTEDEIRQVVEYTRTELGQ
jgi:mono/diheme cytochrome c family protein